MGSLERISRVHGSWRVRVPGHPPKFFADSTYGGASESLLHARLWRDLNWDGKARNRKLSRRDRYDIARSTAHYAEVAKKYGISANYVHLIRRSK